MFRFACQEVHSGSDMEDRMGEKGEKSLSKSIQIQRLLIISVN